MMLVVTQIGWDGSLQRAVLHTAGLADAAQWEGLIAQALSFPPPYRPVPGGTVFHIRTDDHAIMVAEPDLIGPLRDLVLAVLPRT
ncbi:MAG: hypothetical protein LBI49_03985 [Nocardiopsaceae bacterium]|nr:hypothetical protein [Nocardiopsaceae bacterium]